MTKDPNKLSLAIYTCHAQFPCYVKFLTQNYEVFYIKMMKITKNGNTENNKIDGF
jgi:hypothetical protein